MTETAAAPPAARGASSAGPLIVGAVALIALLGVALLSSRQLPLERSATGFDGIVAWLKSNDVEARTFERGLLVRGQVALRVLPLFDTDLTAVSRCQCVRFGI